MRQIDHSKGGKENSMQWDILVDQVLEGITVEDKT